MKKVSYLMVSVLILALMAIGCGQDAPTAPSQDEVVLQPNVREAENAVGAAGNPNGNCCPPGFDIGPAPGNPADHNGDDHICRKVTPGGTITIDNNAPGKCVGELCDPSL